jgi:PadR family transcriptional regulator PadR
MSRFDMKRNADKSTVLRGTLDLLVLQSLAAGPRHGFEIALWLEEGAKGAIALDDSALYQALHRLDERGLIKGEWGTSENNRRAKYYKLTPAGRAHLAGEGAKLVSYAKTIVALLGPARGK